MTIKGKINNCQMITIKSMDLRDNEVERNLKPIESKIEEVRLFNEYDSQLKVGKNLLAEFKEKLMGLLKTYHQCFA